MNARRRGRIAVVVACLACLPAAAWAQTSETTTADEASTQPSDVASAEADGDDVSETAPAEESEGSAEDDAEDTTDDDGADEEDNVEPQPDSDSVASGDAEPGSDDDVSEAELEALEAALAEDAEDAEDANGKSEPPGGNAASDSVVPSARTSGSAGMGAGGLLNLDIAFILDVAAAWFSMEEPLQLGAHDPSQTGFNFQQLEMAVGASVDPYFRFDANLVFSPFGVEVEEAYGTTLALPASLQMRAGQFLTPFGRLNPTHPHSWVFLDQPIANGKFFGGESSRGLGVELSWLSPLPWYVELTGAATEADGECCARSFFGGDNPGIRGPQDLLYTTRLEQYFPFGDAWSLLWGISAQFGPNSTGLGNRTEIYGTDLYLRYKPTNTTRRNSLGLQLEGMFRTRQVPAAVLQDFGGYATLDYQWSARWQSAVRHEWVSGVDDDPLDPDWTGDRHRTSVQTTFFPSHFSRLRLQLAYDAPSWLEEPGYAAMLGLELLVGAHGSHKY